MDEEKVPEIITALNASGKKAVKDVLLLGKCKVDEVDENGMTALHHAAYKGNAEVCKLLLSHGANVNIDSHNHGYSALHFGALSGNLDTCRVLLTSGARTYKTNSLGRTAAQMAGFVGNHAVGSTINNYLPQSEVDYYTIPRGLETEPKLPKKVSRPLYNIIMQVNLHPVYIAMSVGRSADVMDELTKASKVLSLLCEKEVKRTEGTNEVMCMKLHYLSYVLEALDKEKKKLAQAEDKCEETKEGKVPFDSLIKKWLRARPKDGLQENLEYFVVVAVKAFHFAEMPLFLQLVRSLGGPIENCNALGTLHGMINGQRGFEDDLACSTCGMERTDVKKCSKCKSVQYCDRLCQKLHWTNHKKFCDKLKTQYEQLMRDKEEEALSIEFSANRKECLVDDAVGSSCETSSGTRPTAGRDSPECLSSEVKMQSDTDSASVQRNKDD